QQQDPRSANLWLLGFQERIQSGERCLAQRVRAGLIGAGLIWTQLICARRMRRPQRLRGIGYLGQVRYRCSRRPLSFEQGATHSAETEVVRIVLTALRADHDGSPDAFFYSLTGCEKSQFPPPRQPPSRRGHTPTTLAASNPYSHSTTALK